MTRAAQGFNECDVREVAGMAQSRAPLNTAPARLKLAPSFLPCPVEAGDEMFRDGIFEFNITRLMAFVGADGDRFPSRSSDLAGQVSNIAALLVNFIDLPASPCRSATAN